MYLCKYLENKLQMKLFFLLFFSTFLFAQQTKFVDFKTVNASLIINPVKRNVVGNCTYTFEVKKKTDTISIDAIKMEFFNLKINNKKVEFLESKKRLMLFEGYKLGKNTLTFEYEAFPTQAMYFVNWDFSKEIDTPEEVQGQIWTQGQGKNTSNWLPSFDDVNEKVIFGIEVTFHKSFEVVSNGELLNKVQNGDDIIWSYQMDKPMSSYLVMLAIGHFQKQSEVATSGIPLDYYYEKEDSLCVEPTFRYSKKIFDFFENEIGVPYPWKVYRQIPVHDFLYAGMENTTSTLFSRDFVADSIAYNDRNYLNINAHELAHQWFGDLVTAQSGKDHWLQEGFATFYALLAEKEVFGEDYFYFKLYKTAQELKEESTTDINPIISLNASSLTYYQKGAWALFYLRENIGRENFNLVVKNYLNKYAYQNVVTDNFLIEVSRVSDFDIQNFKQLWLEQTTFPEAEINELLQKNEFIKQYIQLCQNPLDVVKDKEEILNIMKSNAYFPVKELLVLQSETIGFDDKKYILDEALSTYDWKLRKAVAITLTEIPESFRLEYETLLNDKSYETKEIALFNLWKQFPEKKKLYLELAKNWNGFQDKNLKLLYLTLSFLTSNEQKIKLDFYHKLLTYTGSDYDSNVQQKALEHLLSLDLKTEEVLRSLVFGTASHRWQFVNFCKNAIRTILKDEKFRMILIKIKEDLPIREKTNLQRLLEE